MFWKKTAKLSAIIIGILGIIDVLWRTINYWVVAGKASESSKYYKGPMTLYDGMIYGGVNAVFLSIIEFVLTLALILLVVSVASMLIDIFNRTHNVNEPTLLASVIDRPKQMPYNPYNQQQPMGMPISQQSFQQPQQPQVNNMGGQPPVFQNTPAPQVQPQQQYPQQPVVTIPTPNNNNNSEWVCECGQVNPAEATFCSKCYVLKK